MKLKNEWRRFEIIEPNNEKNLMNLLESKNITRKDLILILKTIKLRSNKNLNNLSLETHKILSEMKDINYDEEMRKCCCEYKRD